MSAAKMFLISFIVGFSGAMTPGPLLLVTISQTLKMGFIAAPLIIVGHSLLELAATAGLVIGVKELIDKPLVSGLIGVSGGTVMLLMSIGMVREAFRKGGMEAKGRETEIREQNISPGQIAKPVGLGVLISLSNPFWTIWWVTVGAAFIAKALETGFSLLPAFYIGHILSDYVWYGIVGIGIVLGIRVMGGRGYRVLLLICSVFLMLFGVYFLYKGGRSLI